MAPRTRACIFGALILGCGPTEAPAPVGEVIGSSQPFVPERPVESIESRLSLDLERARTFCTEERSPEEREEALVARRAESWIAALSEYSRWQDPRVRETVARCLAVQDAARAPTKLTEAFWYHPDDAWGRTLTERGETLSWPPVSLWSYIDALCAESPAGERCRARLKEYVVVDGARAPPTAIISMVRTAAPGEGGAGAVERTVHRLDPSDGWTGVPLVGTQDELGQLGAFTGFESQMRIPQVMGAECSPWVGCVMVRGRVTCTAGVRDYGGRVASRYSGPCVRAMERIQPPACASQPDACSLEHTVFDGNQARRAELCRVTARGAWLERQTHVGNGQFDGWRDRCVDWAPRFLEEAEAHGDNNPAYSEQLRKLVAQLR